MMGQAIPEHISESTENIVTQRFPIGDFILMLFGKLMVYVFITLLSTVKWNLRRAQFNVELLSQLVKKYVIAIE